MSVLRNALTRIFSSKPKPDMHIDADVQTVDRRAKRTPLAG